MKNKNCFKEPDPERTEIGRIKRDVAVEREKSDCFKFQYKFIWDWKWRELIPEDEKNNS